MSSFEKQLESFVRSGMTDQEIAEALELDITNVCVVTEKFRRKLSLATKKFSSEESSKTHEEAALGVITEIMHNAQNEGVRLKAAQFVIEEASGRNNARVKNHAAKEALGLLRNFALEIMQTKKLAENQLAKASEGHGPFIVEAEIIG